jgi:uncharacterized membrane protein
VSRVQIAAIGISVAGIAISIYLTLLHFAGVLPACVSSGPVNCEAVLSSPYSVVAGSSIPTSALGILWFALNAAAWTRKPGWILLGWSAVGLATVLYLIFIEIVVVGAVCLWCTAAHVLVVANLLLAMIARR